VTASAERFIEQGRQAEAKGRWHDACEFYRKAAIEAPGLAKAHLNLGAALEALGELDGAIVAYQAALTADPGNPYAAYNLGRMLYLRGALAPAEDLLSRALAAKPGFAEARVMLASVYRGQGRLAEAATALETSLRERPDDANARFWLGNTLAELDRTAEAVEQYRLALALQPDHAAAWSNLGHVQIGAGERDAARASFERAVALDPALAEAQLNLGHILKDQGERDAALACYRAALAARPDYAEARWSAVMCRVPVHVEAGENLEHMRSQFAAELDGLAQWFQGVDAAEGAKAVGVQQPFWLAYQERDNRPLLERYGRLCAGLMGRWQDEQGIHAAPRPSPGPVRVAVVSQYFRDHSVWNAIIRGWFGQIDRTRFRLYAFCLGGEADGETAYARRHAERFEHGSRSLRQWADAIGAAQPDVVLYPELGMDPMSIKLAGLRLAPVQVTSWGHPETSGLPTMDYYLSAEMLEPPNAQAHYSERLIELPALGCYVERSGARAIAPRLADFDLGMDDVLLLCPGVPFKYAPRDDALLAEIARRVPRGKLVFFTHSVTALTDKLRERLRGAFARAGLDLGAHAVFLPWQTRAAFHGWLEAASVFLDTVGFSGFNTALQAAERGLPIVTRAGRFMRGRLAAGIVERMGLQELVARSDEDYVALAVRLSHERDYAQSVRSRVAASTHLLFEDRAPVRALEAFLAQAARRP
jgi:protein O-GlcNAc transferase